MPLENERDKGAHLLRRFGLGASEAELDYYMRDGLSGAIEKLLDYESVDEGFTLDVNSLVNAKNGQLNMPSLGIWWGLRMIQTRRPLQEKMTLFWHNHFATSGEKVKIARLMHGQNEILRKNALGSFQTLLTTVSKDPAMLLWLDNEYNLKGHANENFAREVMELFTLGIGHYNEKDIQESARAFTGWSFQRVRKEDAGVGGATAQFLFREKLHDDGDKTFLGRTGNFDGDNVLGILCLQPRLAEFITWKMWRWFAYDDPEPALVQRLAGYFRSSNLDIKTLVREIMKSPEFYSEKAARHLYKNPADFCVATVRQLGVGELVAQQLQGADATAVRGTLAPAAAVNQGMQSMGMQLFFPPDVSGWDGGASWISTATMVQRIGWADRLFGHAIPGSKLASLRYPAFGLFQQDPSALGVARKLASLFDAPLSTAKIQKLAEAAQKASGGRLTPQNANETAAAVSKLIFASPEFQFA